MKHEFLGLIPLSVALSLGLAGCGGDDGGGSGDEVDTSTDDATDDNTETPETSDTNDTSTTDPSTTESTEEGPPPDADMDGIADADDNCPDVANPNQRDFDADGAGNVCDDITYATISGTLTSTAMVDAGLAGSCEVPLDFVSEGGQVLVQLDDDAQLVRIELTQLDIADILDQSCMLLISANVSIVDFSMSNGGDAFPVSFPHNEADHDAGVATGMTNIPHPMMASGTLQASVNGDPPMDSPLDLPDANLPPMAVDISGNGSAMSLTWANDNFNIASSSFDITMPLMITVNLDIVGLNGTLTLAP